MSTPKQSQSHTRTTGAIKGGEGRYVFDLARLSTIDAGPGYSTAHGPVVEGERIQVGLMRMPRGTGGRPHSHPNEQWIYVLQGTLEAEVDGVKSRVPAGSLIYIPADVVHSALATSEGDVLFLTAKDMSHGIAGTPVDRSISAPLYAPGFGPTGEASQR
jgi:quercetin dioxygenase-like cupin family protein